MPDTKTNNYINVGCGADPTNGWLNLDNSFSVKLAQWPTITKILKLFRLINIHQIQYIKSAASSDTPIQWANAIKKIPCPDNSAQAIYSCHMFEHLSRDEAVLFLNEAKRVLVNDGVLRIAVPDLEVLVNRYIAGKDGDQLMSFLDCCPRMNETFAEKINILLFCRRNHKWMYDGRSLSKLLEAHGFSDARALPPGKTTIQNPGQLNLSEREGFTLYVEAKKRS